MLEDPRKAISDKFFADVMLKSREVIDRVMVTDNKGNPYIERLRLKKFPDGSTRVLHVFYRSDEDPWMHDHPWDFESQIVFGSYIEHTPDKPPRIFVPGNFNKKRAEEPHRLELVDGPVITMVSRGPVRRKWCFHTDEGLVESLEWLRRQGITPHG